MKLPLLMAALLWASPAFAAGGGNDLTVDLGPITGLAASTKHISFTQAPQTKVTVFDIQDGNEHLVRGLSLADLLVQIQAPRAADTMIFKYTDGMEVPVALRDRKQVEAVFIAFEHGDVMEKWSGSYPLAFRAALPCPKVVYTRKVDSNYSIWVYPNELASVALVTWKAYEARLAQPTRAMPDRSGWKLFIAHCQPCHGIGGVGAKRGPDFLSNMDAFRRVPPLAKTDRSAHPSLHEKVKGMTEGTMPVLNHIPDKDIALLWRWLHTIHNGATK